MRLDGVISRLGEIKVKKDPLMIKTTGAPLTEAVIQNLSMHLKIPKNGRNHGERNISEIVLRIAAPPPASCAS